MNCQKEMNDLKKVYEDNLEHILEPEYERTLVQLISKMEEFLEVFNKMSEIQFNLEELKNKLDEKSDISSSSISKLLSKLSLGSHE